MQNPAADPAKLMQSISLIIEPSRTLGSTWTKPSRD
jgi:hypothetical protein